MEKHPVLGARLLAVALAGAVAGAWRLEEGSQVCAALRDDRPVAALSRFAPLGGPVKTFLLIYQPVRRTLDLVFVPETVVPVLSALPGLPSPAARFEWAIPLPSDDEPPISARRVLVEKLRGIGFFRSAPALAGPWDGRPAIERCLLLLELSRLGPHALRAAWLPDGAAAAPFLARLLAPARARRPGPGRPPTAEVLNATGVKGVASDATKVLRSRGLDVVYYGNAAPSRARTVVYDRRGDIEVALAARRALACAPAEAATRIDARSLADVTVILGSDCGLKR